MAGDTQGYTFDMASVEKIAESVSRILNDKFNERYPIPAGIRAIQAHVQVGKAAADIPISTSGTVNIYRGLVKGSETFATGDTVTAYARLGKVLGGNWCYVVTVNGTWEVIATTCTTTTTTTTSTTTSTTTTTTA